LDKGRRARSEARLSPRSPRCQRQAETGPATQAAWARRLLRPSVTTAVQGSGSGQCMPSQQLTSRVWQRDSSRIYRNAAQGLSRPCEYSSQRTPVSTPRAVPTRSVVFRHKDCSSFSEHWRLHEVRVAACCFVHWIVVPACMHSRLAGLTCSTYSAAAARSDGVVRCLSTIHYDSTASDVEALLHESLVR